MRQTMGRNQMNDIEHFTILDDIHNDTFLSLNGIRQLAHIQLQEQTFLEIQDNLVRHMKNVNVKGVITTIYSKLAMDRKVYDFIFYQDQFSFESYLAAWSNVISKKISINQCHQLHGTLFGYSKKAIKKGIKKGLNVPSEKNLSNFKAKKNVLEFIDILDGPRRFVNNDGSLTIGQPKVT